MKAARELTKVQVDLTNHSHVVSESMWALPIGLNLYELRNSPFYAYDLNFGDIVEAVPSSNVIKPTVTRVVRRSGHRTLRVFFSESVPPEARLPLLETLNDLGVAIEGATDSFFAIDVGPNGDYVEVCRELAYWTTNRLLEYETCESRSPDRFDDGE
jgi:hypothetical protein